MKGWRETVDHRRCGSALVSRLESELGRITCAVTLCGLTASVRFIQLTGRLQTGAGRAPIRCDRRTRNCTSARVTLHSEALTAGRRNMSMRGITYVSLALLCRNPQLYSEKKELNTNSQALCTRGVSCCRCKAGHCVNAWGKCTGLKTLKHERTQKESIKISKRMSNK